MKVEIKDGWILFAMPIKKPLKLSGTEKSLLLCTTNGPVETEAVYEGQVVTAGINAWIKNPNYVKKPVRIKKK